MASVHERPELGSSRARARAGSGEADLVMTGPITRAGIMDLCACARGLLEGCDARVVVLDLGDIAPDAVAVDALARLQLTVGQAGKRIRFRRACGEIRQLVALMGLADILTFDSGSSVEPGWEVEEGEQVRGVEEERDPRDTSA